jgi:hypothetical protein
MFNRFRRFSMLAAAISSILVIGNEVQAQCSGGGRGSRGPSQSSITTGSFNPLVSLANISNTLAYQRQLAFQQQIYAAQQQQLQQIAQTRYDQQQQLQASRLARAEAKRAKRAEYIAGLKAKRAAELDGQESVSMVASASSGTTLVALSQANPFE